MVDRDNANKASTIEWRWTSSVSVYSIMPCCKGTIPAIDTNMVNLDGFPSVVYAGTDGNYPRQCLGCGYLLFSVFNCFIRRWGELGSLTTNVQDKKGVGKFGRKSMPELWDLQVLA